MEKDKQVEEKLTEKQTKEYRSLSFSDKVQIAKSARAIYNAACNDCKPGLWRKEIKKYSDLCDKCKSDDIIINHFHKLQRIHQKQTGELDKLK